MVSSTAPQASMASVTSAHIGRSRNPYRARCRRLVNCSRTMPTHAAPPRIQLQVPPTVPSEPPPSSRKFESMGAIVCPLAIHQATPRQTRNPPRVTMNEGTPT